MKKTIKKNGQEYYQQLEKEKKNQKVKKKERENELITLQYYNSSYDNLIIGIPKCDYMKGILAVARMNPGKSSKPIEADTIVKDSI